MTRPIEELRDAHLGQTCVIAGTGPSLYNVMGCIPDKSPLIALNQAAKFLEQRYIPEICFCSLDGQTSVVVDPMVNFYSMQKDGTPFNVAPTRKGTVLLVSEHESKDFCPEWTPRYIFNAEHLCPGPFGYREFSGNCALMLAKLMGCNKIVMVGFDACTTGQIGTIYDKKQHNEYFEHCRRMRELIKRERLNVEWV